MHAAAAEAASAGSAVARLLAVKLADLGDVLTATPALRALRQTSPTAEIDVLTSPIGAAAIDGLDSVDRIWVADKHRFDSVVGALSPVGLGRLFPMLVELRARHYDQLLLLHHLTTWFGTAKYAALTATIGAKRTIGLDNGRGGFLDGRVPDAGFGERHEVEYALDVAGEAGAVVPNEPRLEVCIDEASRRRASDLLGDGHWIGLHVGGGTYSLARRWPPELFAEVGRALQASTGAKLALLGTDIDGEPSQQVAELLKAGVLNLVGRTTLKETAAVLHRCRLLVSNDSGVIHIATAVGTAVVAVFGPSNDRAWGPYPSAEHRVVRATLPCSPCFYREKSLGTPEGCPTRDCLKLVTPDMVLAAAEELLARQSLSRA
jgi:lipopolysaccharide heptosyltransferase II